MSQEPQHVRVWDPALRVFHWALAFFVTLSWVLGHWGPAQMTLHFMSGIAIAALLVFRLVWGFVGPPSARFMGLVKGPRVTLDYVRGFHRREPSHWEGHSPMGAWAVIAMLAVLVMQVGSGLISDPDDFVNVGPLASQVSRSTSTAAVGWHHLGAVLILILVVIHVGTILYYRYWKREDLIRPMITGWKWVRRR